MSAGLLGQFGIKTESVWGTSVVVDKFLGGWLSGNPVREQPPLVSQGIRAGRRTPSCISTGAKTVQGTVEMELTPAPLATLLRHMFGTINTTGAGPYLHTASLGPLNGKSFTGQWGIAGTAGTVHPFTMPGCKIPAWTIKGTAGEIAGLSLDISAKDYVTATALASASYLASCPFTFVQGSITVAGVSQGEVKSFELSCTRPLRIEHYMGSALIGEQLETGRPEVMIKVDAEFADLTIHDLANTAVAIVLTFSDGTNSLVVTNNAWVMPMTPEVGGVTDLNSFSFEAQAYHATSDASACTAVLTNTETTSA